MKKNQDKFLELLNPIKDNLWKFCLSISPSRDIAKDLLQDTLLNAYNNFETLKNQQAFLSFLFTIASRLNLARIQKNKNYISLDSNDYSHISDNAINEDQKNDAEALYYALNKLPIEQKEAIILCDILGFSNKEASEIQNVSIFALKQRVYRAKKEIKKILEKDFLYESRLIIS